MTTKHKEARLMVLLKEYESMRAEILNHISHHRQILTLVLGSISFIIPVLLSQANNIDPNFLAGGLYFLSIIYSVISLNTITLQVGIDTIGYYINEYIEPRVNKILTTSKGDDSLLYWETFTRNLRRDKPSVLLVGAFGTVGTILLIHLPAGLFIGSATYLTNLSSPLAQNYSIDMITLLSYANFLASFFFLISILGWGIILYIELFVYGMVVKK